MSDTKVKFSFKETEPDLSTFMTRFKYFYGVTNPVHYFTTDQEILDGVQTVRKYRQMAKESPDGVIEITQDEKQSILRGIELSNANANDKGELVTKPFRMCGFVPVNIPILCGIVLSKPTMFNTIFFQWLN
jgi:hypothetical protein